MAMSSVKSTMNTEQIKNCNDEMLKLKCTEISLIPSMINNTNIIYHNIPNPPVLTMPKIKNDNFRYTPLNKLEGEEMERLIQSIFDKVTLANVNALSMLIKKFNLYNINNLICCVHFIVDQALHVSCNSLAYAKLCVAIKKRKAPCVFNKNKVVSTISFKDVIIRKCQDILHMANIEIEEIQEYKNTNGKMENNQCQQPKQNTMIRGKLLANCKFILELYYVKILTQENIYNILEIMLEKIFEEFIECACHIILSVGEELFYKYDIIGMFNRIKEIIANRQLSFTSKEIHRLVESISNKISKWKYPTIKKNKKKNKKKKKRSNYEEHSTTT